MKKCTDCIKEKSFEEFSFSRVNKDGYRGQCKDCRSKYSKKYRKENKESVNLSNRNYRSENLERCRGYGRKWSSTLEGRAKKCAATAKRNAAKLKATPKWLTEEHLKQIEQFYIEAKELQWLSDPTDPLEVDHIVPLQGKNVSGLHVPWNLQILPSSINVKKSNTL